MPRIRVTQLSMKSAICLLFFVITSPSLASDRGVSFKSFDGAVLSGKISTPPLGTPPRAVVVLVQGSGNVGSDGDVSSPIIGQGYKGQPAKLSDQLAAALEQIGVISIRYDKRGFDDKAQLPHQTIPYLVKDAEAALASVSGQYPGLKTGFVGFSEGALISILAAEDVRVDALFLLSVLSRTIDETFAYQVLEWPVELLSNRIDTNRDEVLSSTELSVLSNTDTLPILGVSWKSLDTNHDGQLLFATEIVPAYLKYYQQLRSLLATPTFQPWYESLRTMAPFSKIASQVSVPVYLYQGMADPQIRPDWILTDQFYFPKVTELRLFPGVGHAFSPLEGSFGQIKTSGPFSNELVTQLVSDVQAAF
jgi:pimeloyl-ACP methyl ester carboxylesterase